MFLSGLFQLDRGNCANSLFRPCMEASGPLIKISTRSLGSTFRVPADSAKMPKAEVRGSICSGGLLFQLYGFGLDVPK